jgi:hypothetical protein
MCLYCCIYFYNTKQGLSILKNHQALAGKIMFCWKHNTAHYTAITEVNAALPLPAA